MSPEQFEAQLNEIIKEQARMSEQIKGALKRIDEQKALTESVHKLALSVEKLTLVQHQTEQKVDSLTRDVDEIRQRPAKKWETVITVGITAFVTALVTLVLTKVGLK